MQRRSDSGLIEDRALGFLLFFKGSVESRNFDLSALLPKARSKVLSFLGEREATSCGNLAECKKVGRAKQGENNDGGGRSLDEARIEFESRLYRFRPRQFQFVLGLEK